MDAPEMKTAIKSARTLLKHSISCFDLASIARDSQARADAISAGVASAKNAAALFKAPKAAPKAKPATKVPKAKGKK